MLKTEEALRTGLRTLIANMIALPLDDGSMPENWDRTIEIEHHIEGRFFPDDMQLEGRIMDAIYQCSVTDKPCTPDTLRFALHALYNLGGDHVDTEISNIIQLRTEDANVSSYSYWLWEMLRSYNLRRALVDADKEITNPWGTPEERIEKAVARVLQAGIDDDDDLGELSFEDMVAERLNVSMPEAYEMIKSGKAVGPSLYFKGFTPIYADNGEVLIPGKIPYLRWGNTTLVTALPGRGKTTLGGYWAERNCWIGGYNVYYIHLETPSKILADRSMSRNMFYPSQWLAGGILDTLDMDDPHTDKLRRFQTWAGLAEKPGRKGRIYQSGRLVYKHAIGWTAFKIANYMAKCRRRSAAEGRGVLFILDYYNLIVPHTTGNVADQLGQVALVLRNTVMRENAKMPVGTGVHQILFAQEGDGPDSAPYGSKQVVQYSQIHISIQREAAKASRLFGSQEKPFLNALGHPRYLHRSGEFDCVTNLPILKANDDQRGTVEIVMENELFAAYSSDGKGNPLPDPLF